MIALQNLEAKTEKLKARIGTLAVEKLSVIERAEAIAEEMKQVALLVSAFEVIAADLEKDKSVEGSMLEQIDSLIEKVEDLESKEDDEGESVTHPD